MENIVIQRKRIFPFFSLAEIYAGIECTPEPGDSNEA
jgi:hypothetical protein